MKRTGRTFAIGALAWMLVSLLPVSAPAQLTLSPDMFAGTDSQKIQAAVDNAIAIGGTVDLGTRHYDCDTGILARKAGSYLTFAVKGSGVWNQFTFTGAGSFLHVVGGKNVKVERIGAILKKDGAIGVEIGTDSSVHSTSGTDIDGVRIQAQAAGCTAYLLGSGPNGDDVSYVHLRGCEAYYDSGDNSTPYLRWKSSVTAANVGFAFVGSNHLSDSMTDCTASGMLVGFKAINHLGYQSGANGLVVSNFGGSFNGAVAWVDGGFDLTWTGGRSEESGALLIHGDALNSGRQRAKVLLRGITLEDAFSKDGIPGIASPGEVIGLHSASKYVLDGVTLGHLYFGDPVGPENVFLRCNDPKASPVFTLNAPYFFNLVSGVRVEAGTTVAPKQGAWKRTVDGVALPTVVAN